MISSIYSPFIPHYPNVHIPLNPNTSDVRVVEVSTRTSVSINSTNDWQQRVEKLREDQRHAAIVRYNRDGSVDLSTYGRSGHALDITL